MKDDDKNKKFKKKPKSQTEEKQNSVDKFSRVSLIILSAIVIGLVLSLIFFKLFGGKYKATMVAKNEDNNSKYNTTIKYLSILDDGTYYAFNLPENIAFLLKNNDEDSFEIKDEDGKKIDAKIKEENGKYILVADEKYTKGKTYTLFLEDNAFKDDKLKDTKSLTFKIKRDDVAEYEFNKNVKEANVGNAKLSDDGTTLDITNLDEDVEVGDVILIKEGIDNYTNAVKINNISGNTATVETPELVEIYDDLNLYAETEIDFNNIEFSDEVNNNGISVEKPSNLQIIESNVESAFVQQPVYQNLYQAAQKTGNEFETNVNAYVLDDGSLVIEISLTVKANGEALLGIEALKNHDLTVAFKIQLTMDALSDIQMGENLDMTTCVKEKVTFDIKLTSVALENLTEEEKNSAVQDIIDKIDGGQSDSISKKISLGSVTYPLMLGVNIYADLYILAQATFQINLECSQETEITEIIGMKMENDTLIPYNSVQFSKNTYEFSIFGRVNSKLGIGFNFGVYFISKDLFKVNFNAEAGVYADAFIIYDTKITQSTKVDVDTYIGGRFELGYYYTLSGTASFNIFFYSDSISLISEEEKTPIVIMGDNELIKGIVAEHGEYKIENQKISIPIVKKKVWNISDDSVSEVEIDNSQLKFMLEDKTVLNVSDGYIYLPSDEDTTIIVQYTGKNISAQTKIKAVHTLSSTGNNSSESSNVWDKLNEFIKKYLSDDAKSDSAHCYSSMDSTFADMLGTSATDLGSFSNISGMETFLDNSLLVVNLYENNNQLVEVVMAGYIDETTLRNVYSQNETELNSEGFTTFSSFRETFLTLLDDEIGDISEDYHREGYYFCMNMLGSGVNMSNFASMLGKDESQVTVEDIAKLFGEQFKVSMYQMY